MAAIVAAAVVVIAEDEAVDIEIELDALDILLTLAVARDIVCNHGSDCRGRERRTARTHSILP